MRKDGCISAYLQTSTTSCVKDRKENYYCKDGALFIQLSAMKLKSPEAKRSVDIIGCPKVSLDVLYSLNNFFLCDFVTDIYENVRRLDTQREQKFSTYLLL